MILFVLSGPSGVGKGTLINECLKKHADFTLIVSATTRAPRQSEINGKDYYFLSDDDFQHHINNDDFLEWCTVHSYRYGTLKSEVDNKQNKYKAAIIEIDVQGAQKLKKHTHLPQYHIFIAPPSDTILKERLRQRSTETDDVILKRLTHAKKEMTQQHLYDFVILNKELTQTVSTLDNVLLNVLAKGVI